MSQPLTGIALTMFGDCCLSLSVVFGKLTTSINPFVFLIVRNALIFAIILPKVIQTRTPFLGYKNERLSLFLNASMFALTSLLIFVSITFMPIGDSSAIYCNYPVLGIFISRIFYKTKVSIVEVVCALTSLVGVVFVAKPQFLFGQDSDSSHENYWIGVLTSIACTVTYAVATTSTQGLKRTPSTTSLIHMSLYSIVLCYFAHLVIVSGNLKMVDCDGQSALIIGSAFLFSVSIASFQFALNFIKITALFPIRPLAVVIAYVLQVAVFREYPTWNSYVGSSIILLSVFTVAVRRVLRERERQKKLDQAEAIALTAVDDVVMENNNKA